MTYKKTKFSNFLWFVFMCITGVMLSNYTMLLINKQINTVSQAFIIGIVLVFLALAAGLFFLFKKVVSPALSKSKINENKAVIIEIIAVMVILAAGIVSRIYLYTLASPDKLVQTNFYQMAIVRRGSGIEPMVHGASYLYVQLLSLFFSFLGNKIMAAVWMQIVIQMLTILLAYFAVRKLLGSLSACIMMFILSVSDLYSSQILVMDPQSLFFLLYIIGLFITGTYVKAYCLKHLSNSGKIWGAVITGAVIGILTYLDLISITLFIILYGLITGEYVTDIYTDDIYGAHDLYVEEKRRRTVSVLLFILSIAAFVFALTGAFVIDSFASSYSIENIYHAWVNIYTKQPWFETMDYQNSFSLIGRIIQAFLAALLIFTYWNGKETQNSIPWICIMIILAPVPLSGVGVLRYQVFYIFVWGVLAGLGLQNCIDIKELPEIEASAAGPVPVSTQPASTTTAQPASTSALSAPQAVSAPSSAENKPRFLENPLPLPKKHEKKELEYQYYVPEHKMKYDIVVSENDDFDI